MRPVLPSFFYSFLLIFLVGLTLALCLGQAKTTVNPAQATVAASSTVPQQAYSLPPDKLVKAIALARIRHTLHFLGAFWGLGVLWLLLATRCAARLEDYTATLVKQRWLQGIFFFAALLVGLSLADLPLSLYAHWVSLRYGLSVQGWIGWLGDVGKSLGLSVLIGPPILLLFNWVVRVSPRRSWLWAWLITLPLMVLGDYGEPLVEPIFNRFELLSAHHPDLVAQLEKVAARTGTNIPPERIYLMKASVKTNTLNAYVSGIGATKRIVVWDTTAGRIPNDEILFIFGHESGHYVLHHLPKGLVCAAVYLFCAYWICLRFAARLARRYGERWQIEALGSRAGFVVLLFTISVTQFLLEPVSNAMSRHFEHEADVYGQEAMHGIVPDPQKSAVAAFNDLGAASLDDPNPNPLIEFWTYGHPSTQRRAEFAAHFDPWSGGGKGKFFKQ
jgi:STE24 endopeptidase